MAIPEAILLLDEARQCLILSASLISKIDGTKLTHEIVCYENRAYALISKAMEWLGMVQEIEEPPTENGRASNR